METVIAARMRPWWVFCLFVTLALLRLVARSTAAETVTIDPARSLFVTDRAVLDSDTGRLFSLERVFDQLVSQSRVPMLTSQGLWSQWWDTLNPSPGLGLGPHCDSHLTPDGAPGINGFPLACPRQEGNEAMVSPFVSTPGAVFYKTTALVNRFDLTPITGEHCGEYRMVFARTPASLHPRNLLIFEAVLPNPTPDLGLEGCRPVAEFWAHLSTIDDPNVRATALADFYFTGLPGFPPVVTIDHYITGQIRTNMFIESLWQLREFKLVHRCRNPEGPCNALRIRPVTDKSNPFGALFNDTSTHPKAPKFRTRFLGLLPGLLADDLMQIAFQNPNRFNAGQSSAQGVENDYALHFSQGSQGSGSFAEGIQQQLTALGSDLTPTHIVRRAMTQSCAGCHQLSTFGANSDLGHGLTWPRSLPLGFVHVDEAGNLSPALRDVFLPHRKAVLEDFLNGTALRAMVAPDASVELTIGGPRRTH
jgi:hypothetical protein